MSKPSYEDLEKKHRVFEKRFRTLMECTTDSVFCIEYDPPIPLEKPVDEQVKLLYDGVIVECNTLCATSHGYQHPGDIIGMKSTELFMPETGYSDDLFRTFITNDYHLSDGESVEEREDGTRRYFLNTANGVLEHGGLVRVWGTYRDITPQKMTELALVQSERKYRKLFESSPDTIILINMDGYIVDISPSVERIFGYMRKDVVGETYSDFPIFDEREKELLKKRFESLKKGNENDSHEFSFVRRDGETKWVRIQSSMLILEDQTLIQVIASDITNRKQAEIDYRESEKKYREIVDLLPETIWETDKNGYITFVSQKGLEKFRYTMEDVSAGVNIVNLVADEDRERVVQNSQRIMRGEIIGSNEYLMRCKDGSMFNAIIHSTVVKRDNEPSGMRGIIVDITDRKQLEEQLQIRERMNSLGTLAGGIAHDFNNLLTGTMGYLELLRLNAENLTDDQRDYLEESLVICKRSAKLIKNFQTLSKDTVTEKLPVDIYKVAREVFSILERTTDRLIEKKMAIEPGKYYLAGQSGQIHQVLLNLGTNAIHAIEEKGTRPGDYIGISASETDANAVGIADIPAGKYIHIIFEDNGIGMTEDVKRRAFDPLFTTKGRSAEKGQGLGLSIVYTIITRNHSGYLKIESARGKGTKIHLFLPKAEAEIRTDLDTSHQITGGTETVLIIEDEESIRKIAGKALRDHGYTVMTSSDGGEGLDVYRENMDTIAIVILDLTMPKLSGEIVLSNLLELNPDCKVIISSGHSEEMMKKHTGAKGYITKPYILDDLVKTVRDVLDA